MRYGNVYLIKDEIIFCSYGVTTDGVGLAIPPYIRLSVRSNSVDIVMALNKIIESNKSDIPHPKQDEWKKIGNGYLEKMGFKSLKSLHKQSICCSIEETGTQYIFCPTRNEGAKGGFKHVPDLKVVVSKFDTNEAIVAAMNKALDMSEELSKDFELL